MNNPAQEGIYAGQREALANKEAEEKDWVLGLPDNLDKNYPIRRNGKTIILVTCNASLKIAKLVTAAPKLLELVQYAAEIAAERGEKENLALYNMLLEELEKE